MTIKREWYVADVMEAKAALKYAEEQLEAFDQSPENNVFESLDAAYALEEVLRDRAYQDCEGAYNCGNDYYEQEFIVDGKHYIASAKVEYNRHDKTYYYIEEFDFKIEEVK